MKSFMLYLAMFMSGVVMLLASTTVLATPVEPVDCVNCHFNIDLDMHEKSKARLGVCANCHNIEASHKFNKKKHSKKLKMKDCTECHKMQSDKVQSKKAK